MKKEQTVSIIGAPLDLGAGHRGVDAGPSAMRIAGLVNAVESMFGSLEGAPQVVVNNAGIREDAICGMMPFESWRNVLANPSSNWIAACSKMSGPECWVTSGKTSANNRVESQMRNGRLTLRARPLATC